MELALPKPKPCSECGDDPVFHYRDYFMLAANSVAIPFFSSLHSFVFSPFKNIRHTGGALGAWCIDVLVFLKLGSYLDAYDDKTLLLDKVLWDEARARGIVMREFRFLGIPIAAFVAQAHGKRIAFSSFPTPVGAPISAWWIDSKHIMKKKFMKLGLPVARGGAALTLGRARKIFKTLVPPAIVKPAEGSGSRHTTIHVTTLEELDHAFMVSQQISTMSVIEEELEGAVYRPTVVGGKLIATIRREQPQVVGDGVRAIAELIEEENKNPQRSGPYYSKIILKDAHLRELKRQGYTPKSIPKAGTLVTLHQKINWSVGGTTTDVTDEVHPENKQLFETVAKILNTPLVGIDFIIKDIGKPWKEQERCGIIECNSRPFFDNHHLPFKGKPQNVAGAIWDYAGF